MPRWIQHSKQPDGYQPTCFISSCRSRFTVRVQLRLRTATMAPLCVATVVKTCPWKPPEAAALATEFCKKHYTDVIMGTIASQITSLTIVYSTIYSDADQRKYQSSASLAFVRGIHRRPVNSPHKWPVTRKMFPFDDIIMCKIIIKHNQAWTSNGHKTWARICPGNNCIWYYFQVRLIEMVIPWSSNRHSAEVPPSAYCEVGVQDEFGHNLLSCSWMWLTSFMGQPLLTLGLTCVCFVHRDFLSLKGGPSTNSNFCN